MISGHGPNKAFLVPDSCRATERNRSNISTDVTDYITSLKRLERRLFQLFSDNLAGVLDFFILHDKHNIRILSFNIKLIWARCETC